MSISESEIDVIKNISESLEKLEVSKNIPIIDDENEKERIVKLSIVPSKLQTKNWRKLQDWYIDGKHNECEIFQRELLGKIVNKKIDKSNFMRINSATNKLVSIRNPYNNRDGYEITEDFDGFFELGTKKFYVNLKFVCDEGGAQTRTLKLVYDFIKCQLEYLLKNQEVYFLNILDGDCSYKNREKFVYLINKEKYKSIRKFIFCGCMTEIVDYFLN